MLALSARTLPQAAARIRRPAYDIGSLRIGLGHVGVGAFHRCHQGEFTDDSIEARPGPWGVVGVNLHPPRLADTLGRQDGLYTRLLQDGSSVDARIIGCLRRTVDAADAPDAAAAALADPAIGAITLTVTEKGYCHVPASGLLDEDHPDIVHDLAPGAGPPRSLPGFLVEVLARRRAAGTGPLALVSCDNLPDNGRILAEVVCRMAALADPSLADWIHGHVSFPCTMVDRIVPATSAADLEHAAALTGLADAAVVTGEPFRQWVIEDRFAGPRPPWDAAGATFVDDVRPAELVKMRLLNAAQTALACAGALCGAETTGDAVMDPVLAACIRAMLERESADTVPLVPGMEPEGYIALTMRRLANPAVRHRCHQIATDTSRKIRQRLLGPIGDRAGRGEASPLLVAAVACWVAYLAAAAPRHGSRWAADDPVAEEVKAMAGRHPDPLDLARAVLGLRAVFGEPSTPGLAAEAIAALLPGLLGGDARGTLAALLR